MKLRTFALLAGLLLISTLFSGGWHATAGERSFAIIVNPDNPSESITKDLASRLFLKKLSK